MKIILFFQESLKYVQAGLVLIPIFLVLAVVAMVLCGSSAKDDEKNAFRAQQTPSLKNLGSLATSIFFFGVFFISGVAASSKCLQLGTLV